MKSIPYYFSRLASLALVALFCGSAHVASAGSATWQQDPATGNWNTPANWNPATVPNGPSDVASFSVSNQQNVTVTSSITLDSIVFQPGASGFTITTSSEFASVLINGAGVINNSVLAQNFLVNAHGNDQGALDFAGSASAGNAIYSQGGGAVRNSFGGTTSFFNTSTAETATFFPRRWRRQWRCRWRSNFLRQLDGGQREFYSQSRHGGSSDRWSPGICSQLDSRKLHDFCKWRTKRWRWHCLFSRRFLGRDGERRLDR